MPKATKPNNTHPPLVSGNDVCAAIGIKAAAWDTPERITGNAICDIMDIAGILDLIAGANMSTHATIEGTQIHLLAGILKDKADEFHAVVTDPDNWARGARS